MAIDPKVYEAVYTVVQNYNQPEKLAFKMMRWLEQVSENPATLSSPDDVKTWIDTIFDAVQTDDYQDEDEVEE
ncbi:MAG TPA: hypothetical protein DCL61_02300 [Cyanobacteria bacterium UBA12227]|nr:hypothetical protein [Cyanobacteria bacterium UBA12227]HAX85928.1 hypothetical protein [Cyanobacteria bacterium UBA11370]HBY78837.1 hypothetical protein [Cyanobacteria bacterium UBA11148]